MSGFHYIEDFDPSDYAAEIAAANPDGLKKANANNLASSVAGANSFTINPVIPKAAQSQCRKFCGYDLPEGVDLGFTDVENPPGLAGRLVNFMRTGAHRQVKGGAYALMSLQIMAATIGRVRGYKRSKMSLLAITLGLSAAGKERPQSVAKLFLDKLGVNVSGDIRSDKDVLRVVVNHDARCVFITDEAQKLLSNSRTKNDGANKNLQNTIMELATSDNFKLAEMHKIEFCEKYQIELGRLEKRIAAKEKTLLDVNPNYAPDVEKGKRLEADISAMMLEAEIIQRKIDTIKVGIRDTSLNLSAFSTHAKLADFIDEAAIESGFLGRGLIADCGVDAERLNMAFLDDDGTIQAQLDVMEASIFEDLTAIYELSKDGSEARIKSEFDGRAIFEADEEAAQLIRTIGLFYDERDEYRNHARLGPMFRRIYERICSISSILALDSVPYHGVATIKRDHVLYALKIILSSVHMLESNLKINEGGTSDLMQDKMTSLRAKIIKQLGTNSAFKYESDIKYKVARTEWFKSLEALAAANGQDVFRNVLDILVSEGVIERSGCRKKIRLLPQQ